MPLTELENALRPIARERIAAGTLPCEIPNQIWAGKGSGRSCDLCDKPIGPGEIEYEVEHTDQKTGRTFHFHIVCQSIWQLECARHEQLKKHPPAPS